MLLPLLAWKFNGYTYIVSMLSFVKLLLLAVIQGATEILPVSSSGHLVIFEKLLGSQQTLTLKIFLHLATLFALMLYFRKELVCIIKSPFAGDSEGLTTLLYILLGSLPAALVGFFLKDTIEPLFDRPSLSALFLLITGVFVILAGAKRKGRKKLSPVAVMVIGLFQAIAILPGISRSGFTIGIALLLGIRRELAFSFSFLLAIPSIAGANLLELLEGSFINISGEYFVAALLSFVVAYLAVTLLGSIVREGKLFYFGAYCVVAGSVFSLIL